MADATSPTEATTATAVSARPGTRSERRLAADPTSASRSTAASAPAMHSTSTGAVSAATRGTIAERGEGAAIAEQHDKSDARRGVHGEQQPCGPCRRAAELQSDPDDGQEQGPADARRPRWAGRGRRGRPGLRSRGRPRPRPRRTAGGRSRSGQRPDPDRSRAVPRTPATPHTSRARVPTRPKRLRRPARPRARAPMVSPGRTTSARPSSTTTSSTARGEKHRPSSTLPVAPSSSQRGPPWQRRQTPRHATSRARAAGQKRIPIHHHCVAHSVSGVTQKSTRSGSCSQRAPSNRVSSGQSTTADAVRSTSTGTTATSQESGATDPAAHARKEAPGARPSVWSAWSSPPSPARAVSVSTRKSSWPKKPRLSRMPCPSRSSAMTSTPQVRTTSATGR